MSLWLWPNGGTTSPPLPGKVAKGFRSVSEYGARKPIDTNGDGKPDTGSFHTGLDLVGFTINQAVTDGVVTYVGANASDGTGVHIDHGDGISSEYIHMVTGSTRVKKGDRVIAGTALGTMGMTGLAEDVHLHLRIKINGAITDPRPFLQARVGHGGGESGATAARRKVHSMIGIRYQTSTGQVLHDYLWDKPRLSKPATQAILNDHYASGGLVVFVNDPTDLAKDLSRRVGIPAALAATLPNDGEWFAPRAT